MTPQPPRKQESSANPFTDLINSINGLILSNQAVVDASKEQTKVMQEQIETLTCIVITGDLKNGKPSLLEVSRDHQREIENWNKFRDRVTGVVQGAVITAIIAGGWYVALHVFGGG